MPRVSVIIPVYNVEKYLKECLDSIVNQTLKDIEIICVNDGSTDNSPAILKEYANNDERIKIIDQENSGAAIARNNAIDIATGDYLLILDSDDYFEKEMIEKMYYQALFLNADITICNAYSFNNQTKVIKKMHADIKENLLPQKKVFNRTDISKFIIGFCKGWSWDKLYKRDFVIKNNLKFQNLRSSNDLYFVFLSLVLAERITVINSYFVYHRTDTNVSLSETRDKKPACFINAILKLKSELEKRNLYKEVEQSFINWAVNFSFWHLDTVNKDNRIYLNNLLVSSLFPALNVYQKDKKYFYNQYNFKRLKDPTKFIYKNHFAQIFSIKNHYENKIMTILGIKIILKRKGCNNA